jgi:prepilin-type N-terminal cleavage/methylation domain-containing protein
MGRFVMVYPLKSQSGVSLVEILITVVVISITSLIILSFSRSIFGMSRDARNSDAAYLSAQEKITELDSKAFPANGSDRDSVDKMYFDRSWMIKDTNNVKLAIVTVTFTSLKGTSRQIKLAGALQ